MSVALQIALFLASMTFVGLVVCIVVLAFQARQRLERLAMSIEAMTKSVETLAIRANRELDDVAHVLRLVRKWSDLADPILDTVDAAIVTPVFSWMRNAGRLRAGATTFIQALFHTTRKNDTTQRENVNVRL